MLLVLLVIAAGGVPIIENPASSLLNAHPRFKYLVHLLQVKGISSSASTQDGNVLVFRCQHFVLELSPGF